MTDNPTNFRRDTAPSLDDLAQRIKTEHQEIMGAKRNIVERAMKAGDLLIQAKAKAGHGNWLNWLKTNCVGISERTANVYMKLADGRATIEEKLKSAATADLTINEALRSLVEEAPEAAETNSTGDAGAGCESKTTGTGSSSTVTGTGSTKTKGGSRKASNTSDTVDDVTERLIELLKKLETETAIAAVAVIVRRFGDANWLPAAERKKAA
jgi:hypothetical protein